MNKFILKADKRALTGSKVKKLRRQGILPGNIFGHNIESQAIQVSDVEFSKVFKNSGETSLVWVKIEGESKERPTLIKSVTLNPITGQKQHIDLHQVNLKEKVTANIPVEIVGESQLVKDGLAVLDINLHELEVEALPTELPESINFDITNLNEIGDQLKAGDVKLPEGVELMSDPETIVIIISAPQKEEEVVPAETVSEEVTGAVAENTEEKTQPSQE